MYAQINPGRKFWEIVSCAYTVSATERFQRTPQSKRGACRPPRCTHRLPTHGRAFLNRTPRERADGNDPSLLVLTNRIYLHGNKRTNTQFPCYTITELSANTRRRSMFPEWKRFPLGALRMRCLPPPTWAGRGQKSTSNWKVSRLHYISSRDGVSKII